MSTCCRNVEEYPPSYMDRILLSAGNNITVHEVNAISLVVIGHAEPYHVVVCTCTYTAMFMLCVKE